MADAERLGGEVAGLDGEVRRRRPVAVPVGEPEHRVTDGDAGRPGAERDHDAGELVTRDHRAAVPSGAVDPGRGPGQLGRRDARRVHGDQDVADAGDRSRRRLVPELLEVARLRACAAPSWRRRCAGRIATAVGELPMAQRSGTSGARRIGDIGRDARAGRLGGPASAAPSAAAVGAAHAGRARGAAKAPMRRWAGPADRRTDSPRRPTMWQITKMLVDERRQRPGPGDRAAAGRAAARTAPRRRRSADRRDGPGHGVPPAVGRPSGCCA